ncbi:MAG: glycoside hydrolase family 3 protein [Sphaerochaeta sp.]
MNREDLRKMIGQHFVCGFDGPTISDEFRAAVKTHKIANIILFARNVKSKEQLKALTNDIQELVRAETGSEAFICIDQEGGMVTRLSSDFTNVPGAMALGATKMPSSAYTAGTITGSELRAAGVNVDFAPALDVNSNPNNPVIGVRSYSDDPAMVGRLGLAMVEGLQKTGVIASGKHFPGHGDTHIDTHLALPTVINNLDLHLAPFKTAIDGGVKGIMTSHILFPELEDEYLPATMSRKILTNLLKDKLGFTGLVFTDCMEMKAIADNWGTVKGSLLALKAGVDIVCISHHVNLGVAAIELVEEAYLNGELDSEELAASTKKILAYKEQLADLEEVPFETIGSADHTFVNKLLHEATITLVHDAPFELTEKRLFIGPRPFKATNVSNDDDHLLFGPALANLLGGDFLTIGDNPDEEEIQAVVKRATTYPSVVIGTYNGHLFDGQLALANAVSAVTNVALFALRNPYDVAYLNPSIRSYAAWAYTPMAFEAIARILTGEIYPNDFLPIHLGGSNA